VFADALAPAGRSATASLSQHCRAFDERPQAHRALAIHGYWRAKAERQPKLASGSPGAACVRARSLPVERTFRGGQSCRRHKWFDLAALMRLPSAARSPSRCRTRRSRPPSPNVMGELGPRLDHVAPSCRRRRAVAKTLHGRSRHHTALELANCETASALNQGDDGLSHDPSLVAACKEERAKARGPQFLIGAALTGVTELVGARFSLANTRHARSMNWRWPATVLTVCVRSAASAVSDRAARAPDAVRHIVDHLDGIGRNGDHLFLSGEACRQAQSERSRSRSSAMHRTPRSTTALSHTSWSDGVLTDQDGAARPGRAALCAAPFTSSGGDHGAIKTAARSGQARRLLKRCRPLRQRQGEDATPANEPLQSSVAQITRLKLRLSASSLPNSVARNRPLAAHAGLVHIGPIGDVAEWLKAAVC
jgi:hypothetical protein